MITLVNLTNQLPKENSFLKPDFNRIRTKTIVVHHSGVEEDAHGNIIQNLHNIANYSIREKWYAHSLQYHYVIDREGKIYYCVEDNKFLPHCSNLKENWQSIAVCILGYGDNSTEIQESKLAQLIGYIRTKYPTINKVSGHRDYWNTYCPSNTIYNKIHLLNNISGAKTIMEAPYKEGDLVKVNVGNSTLGYRKEPSINGQLLAVGGLPSVGRLKNGTILKALGHYKEADGYLWMDVNVRPSYPEEGTFATGWVAIKRLSNGQQFVKLYKTAEKAVVSSAQTIINEIKKKQKEIVALYNKLDKLVD